MTIDVHAHFVPPTMLETLDERGRDFGVSLVEREPGARCCVIEGGATIRPFFDAILDVEGRLAEMDRQTVDREILTLWADLFAYDLPADKGAVWHRHMNDHLAALVDRFPDRFSWMGSCPMQHQGAAVIELERCKSLGALGAIAATELRGQNLGEADLDEFWEACVSLEMPVFLHPSQPVPSPRARRFALAQICAYTYDTTLTAGSLISSGVLDRFPGLQIILSHGGGLLPWLIGRFDRMYRATQASSTGTVCRHAPSQYLERFHYDTILHDAAALGFLATRVGVKQLLLGTDLPFPPGDPDPFKSLRDVPFNAQEIQQIVEDNPRSLFDL